MERLHGDDLEALDELYRLTREDVARTLYQLTGRASGLEPLVADVYLALARSPAAESASVHDELLRCCVEVALRQLGAWRKAGLPDSDRSPVAVLTRALSRVSPKARVVFVLAEVAQVDTEAIARCTGLSLRAIPGRLAEARVALTRFMQSQEVSP